MVGKKEVTNGIRQPILSNIQGESKGGSMDYKEGIMLQAFELAWEEYEMDFYDLPEDIQDRVYTKAEELYWEDQFNKADSMKEKLL